MKIKLDENLPAKLTGSLQALGHDTATPFDEGLSGAADSQLWEAVQQEGRFLITQDLDFSDARRFRPGTHHGLLPVRLREPSRRALQRRIEWLFQYENVADWSGCFAVVTDHKIRVRKPGG